MRPVQNASETCLPEGRRRRHPPTGFHTSLAEDLAGMFTPLYFWTGLCLHLCLCPVGTCSDREGPEGQQRDVQMMADVECR